MVLQDERWVKFKPKLAKMGENIQNHTLGVENNLIQSPMAMNYLTYLKQTWGMNLEQVLGSLWSFWMKNGSNLSQNLPKMV